MRRTRVVIIVAVVALLAVLGGWVVYATLINDPAAELTTDDLAQRLDATTVPDSAATTTSDATPDTTSDTTLDTTPAGDDGALDGEWSVTDGTEVGYRVAEMLGGISTEGVGRTQQVEGTMSVAGTVITDAEFTVDVASITSDSSRRDGQFSGRIMETSLFPTATFVLTEPIEFGAVPADGESITVSATGDLTLHGVTRSVTFDITARIDSGRIGVLGSIPIVFADYDISNPSFGPVQTEDNGVLEVLLVLEPA